MAQKSVGVSAARAVRTVGKQFFPRITEVIDDLCVIRSMVGETPLHGAQSLLLHTGRSIGAAPSIGSWISYGLGTENEQLPGYVLLNNDWIPNGGFQNFASSYLPATHQATLVRAKEPPSTILFLPIPPMSNEPSSISYVRRMPRGVAKAMEEMRSSPPFAIMRLPRKCRHWFLHCVMSVVRVNLY